MEKFKEEKVERIIKDAPLAVGSGVVEVSGDNVKCLGVFMDLFKDK